MRSVRKDNNGDPIPSIIRNPIPNYSCTIATHRAKVVGDHGLTENEFKSLIRNFFGSDNDTNTPYDWSYIADLMDLVAAPNDCLRCAIILSAGDPDDDGSVGNTGDSEDIIISKDCNVTARWAKAYYSYALFRGVNELYKADKFEFYKARKNGINIFVFKAYNSAVPQNVYFGDLSELYP